MLQLGTSNKGCSMDQVPSHTILGGIWVLGEGITSCKVDMGSSKHVQTAPEITLKVVLRLRYMDNPGDILVRPTIYEPWDDPLG
jgi:hypothetical protein